MFSNLAQLFRYRGLIQSLVARELKARYRGSVLGFLWSFLNPLLVVSIYSFVFAVVLPGLHSEDISPYHVFMFCGILPWTWFSLSLLESASSLVVGGNLIKKVMFPAEVLPITSVLANMVHFTFGLPILFGFLAYYRRWPDPLGLLWLPVAILVQLLLTAGFALIFSALMVHFRDLRDILSNLLTLWFFSTPILYSMREAPGLSKQVLDFNPMTHVIVSYQEILFYPGGVGHWKWLLATGAEAVVLFLVGYWLFDRLRDSFAEMV